jgi:hypothetical protein
MTASPSIDPASFLANTLSVPRQGSSHGPDMYQFEKMAGPDIHLPRSARAERAVVGRRLAAHRREPRSARRGPIEHTHRVQRRPTPQVSYGPAQSLLLPDHRTSLLVLCSVIRRKDAPSGAGKRQTCRPHGRHPRSLRTGRQFTPLSERGPVGTPTRSAVGSQGHGGSAKKPARGRVRWPRATAPNAERRSRDGQQPTRGRAL